MNIGDTVKFSYINTGDEPITRNTDTIYFDENEKKISVGDVKFDGGTVPTHSVSDENKMLSVNAQNNLEWKNVPKELPASTSADEGKVLSVDSSGLPEWATPSGGDNIPIYEMTWNGAAQNYVLSNITVTDLITLYNNAKPFLLSCAESSEVFIPTRYESNILMAIKFNSSFQYDSCNALIIRSNSTTTFKRMANTFTLLKDTDTSNKNKLLIRNNSGNISALSFPMPTSSDANKMLSVNSSGVYALANVPKELPTPISTDEGKVLKVDDGVPKWLEDQDAEIPSHTTSDEGKMLSVNAQNGLEWKDVPTELPASTSADEGKVLSVDSSGLPEWALPQGGDNKFKFYSGTYSSNRVKIINQDTMDSIQADFNNGYIPVIIYSISSDIKGSLIITRFDELSPGDCIVQGYSIIRTTETGKPAYIRYYHSRASLYLSVDISCWIPNIPKFPELPADGKYLLVANVSNYNATFAWELQP